MTVFAKWRGPSPIWLGQRRLHRNIFRKRFNIAHSTECNCEGGATMSFEEILEQALAILQRRGRVSYRALQRQFALDAAYLEDVKAELLYAYPQVADDEGRGLVWTGDIAAVPESASSPPVIPQQPPSREDQHVQRLSA